MSSGLALALALGLRPGRLAPVQTPSAAFTTWTAADPEPVADGSPTTLTAAVRDALNAPIPGLTVVAGAPYIATVDADLSTFVAVESEIPNDGTTPANFVLTVRVGGIAMPGIPASAINIVSSRGEDDEVEVVDAETSAAGQVTVTLRSTEPGVPTLTASVYSLEIGDTPSVTVTGEAPSTLTPEFLSFFSNSTGTGAAAITDGSKWADPPNNFSPGGQGLEVISSAGLDFPTTNVLRVTALEASEGYAWLRTNQMATVGVGAVRNFRFYLRVTLPDDLADFEQHPIQDGNSAGGSNWMFKVMTPGTLDGQWYPRIHCQGGANFRFEGPVLDKGVTYRFDLQLVRTGTTTFRFHVSVFSGAGVLLADDADFESDAPGSNPLSDNPTLTIVDAASFVGLNAGSNGITPPAPWPFVQSYQTAFAVVDDLEEGELIGAFGSVDGES